MELLRLPFTAVGADYEEDMSLDLSPEDLVAHLALGKAQAVAKDYADALVIGGDTIVVHDGTLLGKPYTSEKAREMLQSLRGATHQIMTGLAVIDTKTGETRQAVSVSDLRFRDYTDEEIENYLQTGEPFDRAGAYALQGYASLFAQEIRGDYYSILGLSVVELRKILDEFGIDVWEGILGIEHG